MGPEGGERGGKLLYQGPRDGLLSVKWSFTADCLRQFMDHKKSLKAKKK
jgi:excinuclease UvrABC ATPase subunit